MDLKQVPAGLAVSADGGIPVHARVFGGRPGSLAHRAEMAAHPVEPPAGAATAPGSAEGLPGRLHDRRRVPAPRAAARAGTRHCAVAAASSRSAPPSTGRRMRPRCGRRPARPSLLRRLPDLGKRQERAGRGTARLGSGAARPATGFAYRWYW
ncbi:hypothetical protein [Streptomyces sp. SD15]